MRAVQVTEFGGPEVLRQVELPDPEPGRGQVLVDVAHAGVNYADTHQAENTYLAPSTLPLVPGGEVAGRAEDGRRVVSLIDGGGYAQRAVADRARTYDIPDDIDDLTALSFIVQGTTAWLLLKRNAQLREGESVVVHAAAGGVGTIAVQLARAWGAGRIIATASSAEKRNLALELGADEAVDSRSENMTDALRAANGGRRVDIVLDMTGGRITDESVVALAPFGRLAFYGMAGREQPKPVALPSLLKHSTTVSGMWLPHAFSLPGDVFGQAISELFDLATTGSVRAVSGGVFGLSEVRRAHEALRSRVTTGKLVLDTTR